MPTEMTSHPLMASVIPATAASVRSNGDIFLFAPADELARVRAVVAELLRFPPEDLSRENRD